MRNLLEAAQKKLAEACKDREDFCSVCWHMGYIQAIKDAAKKLKEEGLDELEDV